jgi:hypothetical protein
MDSRGSGHSPEKRNAREHLQGTSTGGPMRELDDLNLLDYGPPYEDN